MTDVAHITVNKLKLVDDCVSLIGDSIKVVTMTYRGHSYILEIREVNDEK